MTTKFGHSKQSKTVFSVDQIDAYSPTLIPTVSVVIPALNEARNLPSVFSALPRNLHQVILVDGGSTDDTVKIALELRKDVCIVQQTYQGKGNALACGFAEATGDIIVTLDADGSSDPKEIPIFVAALTAGEADFAKGSRFLDGGGSSDITSIRSWGNRLFTILVNLFFHTHFSDLCYGYNAFWRSYLPAFGLDEGAHVGDGFEIETLINIRAIKLGLSVIEVPSFERERIYGKSNLRAIPDGIRVIKTIMRELRTPLQITENMDELTANIQRTSDETELSA
ncbi:MAG: glycosyltransferase family 2 protein [Acidimicrobiaceae bacterium]|nr:glycosyltransferase family 2 protein [Acidimicrobiaceae bacterium]